MARGDRGGHALLIVGAIGGERGHRCRHLVEQRADLGGVVGLQADVQRAPSRSRSRRVRCAWRGRPRSGLGASGCRASRPTTRPSRTASGRCCPPAGAGARRCRAAAGVAPPASRRGGCAWRGPHKASPSRLRVEPTRPSVRRSAGRNTARSVSAVRTARGDYQGCPPRIVRGSARQAAIASSVTQTVKPPRWRKAASCAAEWVTLRLCFGMWRRRSWFSLNSKAGIPVR